MNSKHTPGPWTVGYRSDSTIPRIRARTGLIAEVNPLSVGDETTNANARLIAAAPDLLAALRGLMKDCNLTVTGHGGRMDSAILAARAALAKAEARP